MKENLIHVEHPFKPLYNENSKILILGSFPSVKSREFGFYYGHPQNRFWKVLSLITNTGCVPEKIEDKKKMLINNGIALWDVISSCDIYGSSDSSIKNAVPSDIFSLVDNTKICSIYANGGIAYSLYVKYFGEKINIPVYRLPSTSPANASYSFEKLLCCWKEKIKEL